MLDRNSPNRACRRMAVTTRLPTTSARMSFPSDSATNSWIRIVLPRDHRVSSTDWTACSVSARITPIPCVPWMSLSTTGGPPTASSAAPIWWGSRAMTVRGMLMSLRVKSWKQRSLSRERAMGCELLMGVPLINNSQPIARSRDKLRCFQLLTRKDINMPRTVVAREPHQIGPALEAVGGPPVVLKLIQGTQGIGVILAETEQAVQSVLDTLWSLGKTILIQEFVAESEGKDIRALVVGNRVVTAMRRQARFGEFRSNIHRGGDGAIVELDEDYKRAAVQATQVVGLRVAGVDLLESREGPKVLE